MIIIFNLTNLKNRASLAKPARITAFLLAILLLAALSSSIVSAAQQYRAYAPSSKILNMRQEPSTNSAIIAQIPHDTVLNVTETRGSWGRTSYNNRTGWISLDHAVKVNNPVYTAGQYRANAPVSGILNLRQQATANSSVIAGIPHNTVLNVTAVSGAWGQTSYNGRTGWVSLEHAVRTGNISVAVDFSALRTKFPHGKYWTHTRGIKDTTGNTVSNSNTCTTKKGSHTNENLTTGNCGCNSFNNAIQCMGFAFKIGHELTGKHVRNWTRSTSKSDVDKLKAGDYIRWKNNGHSAIVLSKDSTYIYVVECNAGGNNSINWNGKYAISSVKNTLTEIRWKP